MSFLSSLVTGAASVFGINKASSGQSSTNSQNVDIANRQMAFNKGQNATQMYFQQKQANTSFRRGMADMKFAGLNPILAYKQGGAGSPAGSSGGGAGIAAQNPDAAYAGLGQAASNAASLRLQEKQNAAQVDNLAANTALANTNAKLSKAKITTEAAQQASLLSNSANTQQRTQTEIHNTATARWGSQTAEAALDKIIFESNIISHKSTGAALDASLARIKQKLYDLPLAEAIVWAKEIGISGQNLNQLRNLKKTKPVASPKIRKKTKTAPQGQTTERFYYD